MTKKVCDLIADFFEEKGIRHIFGIVGAGNASIFDAIYRKGYTQIICVHHEQAACMAMETYFRISGKLTAALLTTGGGSTNGITGVVGAWMDSLPGIIIAGNENSKFTKLENHLRIWGVQGYDSIGMVKGVTKYAKRIIDPKNVWGELHKGYVIAEAKRPGPVWLEIPMDIQSAKLDVAPEPYHEEKEPLQDLRPVALKTLKMLLCAKRPVFWLGHGIRLSKAVNFIEPLLNTLPVPALVSWAGIDMLDSSHSFNFGSAGVYGQRCANFVLQNSDLVICIGTRMAIPQVGYDLSEFARDAKIIVNDIDPLEVAKHGDRIALGIAADAGAYMQALIAAGKESAYSSNNDWICQCQTWKSRYPRVGPEHKDEEGYINSYSFIEKLSSFLKSDQIIVTDMGTALLSAHQVLRLHKGQRLLTSTGLGEMGFGLPGAMGASFASNCGEVVCLNCDGGMMMNLQELQTVIHHQLPIKIYIFNNDGYLMIKHTQKSLFEDRRSGTDRESGVSCPDFTALAKAFGMPAFQIRTWNDFEEVIPKVQNCQGPVICEVFMHPRQPLVPKLSLAMKKDGSLVSPPLEDLSPMLSLDELKEQMIVGVHSKSEMIGQR